MVFAIRTESQSILLACVDWRRISSACHAQELAGLGPWELSQVSFLGSHSRNPELFTVKPGDKTVTARSSDSSAKLEETDETKLAKLCCFTQVMGCLWGPFRESCGRHAEILTDVYLSWSKSIPQKFWEMPMKVVSYMSGLIGKRLAASEKKYGLQSQV